VSTSTQFRRLGRLSRRIWPIFSDKQIGAVPSAYTLEGILSRKAFQRLLTGALVEFKWFRHKPEDATQTGTE
jgi:hypothetical protein